MSQEFLTCLIFDTKKLLVDIITFNQKSRVSCCFVSRKTSVY